MFSDLLSQFNQVMNEAKQNTKKSNEILKESHGFGIAADQNFNCDPTKTYGHATSFPKEERFKAKQKQQLNVCDISFVTQISEVEKPVKNCIFSKTQRFEAVKPSSAELDLNPNYSVVKKNVTNKVPIMKKSIGEDLKKSNISAKTATSFTDVGPAAYFIPSNQTALHGRFLQASRFSSHKNHYQDTPLFINQNQIKKRPPTALIKKQIQKNTHLISLQKQEEIRQKMKFIYWKTIPLELDRLYKTNIGPIIRDEYFNLKTLKGREKRCAILMFLQKMNLIRGGFQNNIESKLDNKCSVKYRRSTPKPFKFSEMEPGPQYYYPCDDLIKKTPIGYTFIKNDESKIAVKTDHRDYELNQTLIKKGGNIVINPIHMQHKLSEQQIRNLNRGPGYYDSLFNLVQKRNDIGVIRYEPINDKNARQNNCIELKQVNDGIYFPSYEGIDPKIAGPLYKENANVKPIHLPAKVLFPEHWLFYDGDLNKVRAEIAKNVILANNMQFQQYQTYIHRFNLLKQYLASQKHVPEVGQYSVKFQQIDPHIQAYQMEKQPQKHLLQPILKPEGNSDGDNLILHPHNFQEHLPNMEFKKMAGRNDNQPDYSQEPKEGDRLLINPKKIQNKIANILFQKMEGRPIIEALNEDSEAPEGDRIIIHPKLLEKHLPNIDFSKQKQREEIQNEPNQDASENIVNLQQKTNIKGVPFSRLSTVKLVPVLRSQEKSIKKRKSISKKESEQENDEEQ